MGLTGHERVAQRRSTQVVGVALSLRHSPDASGPTAAVSSDRLPRLCDAASPELRVMSGSLARTHATAYSRSKVLRLTGCTRYKTYCTTGYSP